MGATRAPLSRRGRICRERDLYLQDAIQTEAAGLWEQDAETLEAIVDEEGYPLLKHLSETLPLRLDPSTSILFNPCKATKPKRIVFRCGWIHVQLVTMTSQIVKSKHLQ